MDNPNPEPPSRELGLTTSFFTFGHGHFHHIKGQDFNVDRAVKIVTRHEPRDVMIAIFGVKWSMEYDEQPEERYIPQGVVTIGDEDLATKYGIDPLTLQKLPTEEQSS